MNAQTNAEGQNILAGTNFECKNIYIAINDH